MTRLAQSTCLNIGRQYCSRNGLSRPPSSKTSISQCQSSPVPMRLCKQKARSASSTSSANPSSRPFQTSCQVSIPSEISLPNTDVTPTELQCYADWCAENRSLWQQRLNDLTAAADATHLVQPIVESAADEERFRTLFPLSLPASLVGAMCLEPGPIGSSPTSPKMQSSLTSTAHEGAESPAAKAMRAVYHANLLDHRHRLSSYHGGIASLEFAGGRRMSSPNTMPSSALAM